MGDLENPELQGTPDVIKSLPSNAKQTPEHKRIDALFNRQYLRGGGFCGFCGEGVEPYVKGGDADLFGKCEYNGEHPRCSSGEHKMEFEGKTPETFGGYEIYRCINPNCDYSEAL